MELGRETYITVLIGIIIGMALTRIVKYVGHLVTKDKETRSIRHLVWLAGLILLLIQSWWAMHTDWNFENAKSLATFAMLLLSPTLLYLITALLCPDLDATASWDPVEHHRSIRAPFYVVIAVFFLALIPEAVVMNKEPVGWFDSDNFFRLGTAAIFVSASFLVKRCELIDKVLPILVVALLFSKLVAYGPTTEEPPEATSQSAVQQDQLSQAR